MPSLSLSTKRSSSSNLGCGDFRLKGTTMTAVLLLLVMSILTAKRIYGAVHLPILKARQAPQAITPVIDTNAFNQCFKNSAVTFAGSPCYPAVYDFVQCFEINQTMMWDQTPAGIYECACLPWPIDNRTYVSLRICLSLNADLHLGCSMT